MTRSRLSLLAATVLLSACATDSPTSAGGLLRLGTWGGNNVVLIATDSVLHVHIGCTFGDFPSGTALDATGHFTAEGSYMLHAYPVAVGPAMPAELSGQVIGNTLTFAIAVNDTTAKQVYSLGPGTVVFGKQPSMGPCPVCAIPGMTRALLIKPSRRVHR